MSGFFTGLPNSFEDRVALAVRDLLDTDDLMRGWFSGSIEDPALDPTGTVDISPGSTSMLGTGSNWLITLRPGFRVLINDQVGEIATVTSDGSATLKVAHADGAISANGDVVSRGPRSERVNATDIPVDMALPYYTVGIGQIADAAPAIGRLEVNPTVQIMFVFPRQQTVLRDDEASWGGLAAHVRSILAPKKGVNDAVHRLCVPRFDLNPLVRRVSAFAAGGAPLLLEGEGTVIFQPALQVAWQGMDPQAVEELTQRW